MAKFHLTVVYVAEKDSTVADCLSTWAYRASKGMADLSAHADEAKAAEAKNISNMERMMEQADVKCLIVLAADAFLSRRVDRGV